MEPIRTCIGCGGKYPKYSLLRIGRTKDGEIKVGIKEGRGAYICHREQCLRKALRGDKLAKALKVKGELSPAFLQTLLKEIEVMMK